MMVTANKKIECYPKHDKEKMSGFENIAYEEPAGGAAGGVGRTGGGGGVRVRPRVDREVGAPEHGKILAELLCSRHHLGGRDQQGRCLLAMAWVIRLSHIRVEYLMKSLHTVPTLFLMWLA